MAKNDTGHNLYFVREIRTAIHIHRYYNTKLAALEAQNTKTFILWHKNRTDRAELLLKFDEEVLLSCLFIGNKHSSVGLKFGYLVCCGQNTDFVRFGRWPLETN